MKTIKIIGLTLLTFVLSGNINAQKANVTATSIATEEVDKEYVIETQTLKKYFTSLEIPASFPKYDNTLGKKENQKLALTWVESPENHALLSQEGVQKLEEFKAKASAKGKRKPLEKTSVK